MMYFPVVPSTDYELHPVNRTEDLIVHKIIDPIPTEQVELMDEKVEANMFVDDMVLSQPIPGTRQDFNSTPKSMKKMRTDCGDGVRIAKRRC
ncbi:hypothetical protein Tco_0397277 [Tanacetum coccineum]